MERITGQFEAQNARGKKYTIVVWTGFARGGPPGSADEWVPGFITLKTTAGELVNRIEKGKYQIVGSPEILTSSDPAAS